MKISKAIEIQTFLVKEKPDTITANEKDAIELGIEALKELEKSRREHVLMRINPLPGETPED